MNIKEMMKLPFTQRRKELLKAYVKVIKKDYPDAKCKMTSYIIDVKFPREKKFSHLKLSGEWEGWKFFAWREKYEEEEDNVYRYTVSIYPKGTQCFMLREIDEGYEATDKQRNLIRKTMLSRADRIMECPEDKSWMKFISVKRASELLDALFHNQKIAIVYDMERDEKTNLQKEEEEEEEDSIAQLIEQRKAIDKKKEEWECHLFGNLVKVLNTLYIASKDEGYLISLKVGKRKYTKPCTQPEFMYFKLRNHPENDFFEKRKPVVYLAIKYFADILDELSVQEQEPFFIYKEECVYRLFSDFIIKPDEKNVIQYFMEKAFKSGDFEKDASILVQGNFVHHLKNWDIDSDEYEFYMIGHNERHILARKFISEISDRVDNNMEVYLSSGGFLEIKDECKRFPEEVDRYTEFIRRIETYERSRNRKPLCFVELMEKAENSIYRGILYFTVKNERI